MVIQPAASHYTDHTIDVVQKCDFGLNIVEKSHFNIAYVYNMEAYHSLKYRVVDCIGQNTMGPPFNVSRFKVSPHLV